MDLFFIFYFYYVDWIHLRSVIQKQNILSIELTKHIYQLVRM